MTGKDWFVSNDGQCLPCDVVPQTEELSRPYRLYRFLTDLEDILDRIREDRWRLEVIRPLVRKLLTSSDWLQIPALEPNPETGWEVLTLYDEPFFPLTVQLVAWKPGMTSAIHNHGCWGLVALLSGEEKNTFWQRSCDKGDRSAPQRSRDRISPNSDRLLTPGDILCLMPDAIHHVEAMGDEPTISFNLYGETNYNQRFEFDSVQGTAKNF
jgi:predicted metal-dependent enzyme (double-stranded beta helix superfamily)